MQNTNLSRDELARVIEGKGAASRIPLLYLHTAGRALHADHGQWFHLGLEAGKSESSLRSIPSLTNPRRFPIRNRRGITAPAPLEKTDTSGRLNIIRRPEVFWYYSISCQSGRRKLMGSTVSSRAAKR